MCQIGEVLIWPNFSCMYQKLCVSSVFCLNTRQKLQKKTKGFPYGEGEINKSYDINYIILTKIHEYIGR